MERKLHAGVRSARSISRYDRPRLVVAPRTYMDVMPPAPVQQGKGHVQKTTAAKVAAPHSQQPKTAVYFDVKPSQDVSRPIQRVAPTLKPISNEPIAPAPILAPAPLQAPSPAVMEPTVVPPTLAETPAENTQEAVPEKVKLPLKKRLKAAVKKRRALHAMAALLFVAGMYVTVDGWLANRAVTAQANVLSAQAEKSAEQGGAGANGPQGLDEKKPAGVKNYRVAPDLPKSIKIPSLNVSARVLHLGVKNDNSLAVPPNIYDAGWYTASARPTDTRGAILIDGHVSGPTKQGVFYGLKKMKAGDEITLERGDGQRLVFAVQKVETVDVDHVDMSELLRSSDPSKLGLNLITCGGSFDVKSNEFKSRVLVFAVQK